MKLEEGETVETLTEGLVIGVSRWKVNRQTGGRLNLLTPNSGFNDDLIGLEFISPAMPYQMFDQFVPKKVPAWFEILIDVTRGAGGRDTERLKSVRGNGELQLDRLSELFAVKVNDRKPKSLDYYHPQSGSLVGLAVSATRYDMEEEGIKGGSIFFIQPVQSSDVLGFECVQMRIPYELFDQFKEKGLPGEYRVSVQMVRRGQNRPGMMVHAIDGENTLTNDRLRELFKFSASVSPPSSQNKGS